MDDKEKPLVLSDETMDLLDKLHADHPLDTFREETDAKIRAMFPDLPKDWRSGQRIESIEFTPDEIETIKLVLAEWGFEYSLRADADKVDALCKKLGVRR